MWAGWSAYLSAYRDILGLRLPIYEKFKAWEDCSIHGGFRFMHEEFCMVCDFPEILKKDDQNRPHCDDGPSHRWRDGWSLYHVHGVRVPRYVIEEPHLITVKLIEDETNAEVRRVMIDRYPGGPSKYITDSGSKILDHDERWGTLRIKHLDDDEDIVMLEVVNRTPEPTGKFKRYHLRVPPTCRTAHEAVAWTFGKTPETYNPVFES
jgi:hypothetical protein